MSPDDPKDMSYISEPESVENNIVITPVDPDPLDRAVEVGAAEIGSRYPSTFGGSYAMPREVARAVLQAVLTEGAIEVTEPLSRTEMRAGLADARAHAAALRDHLATAERERDAAREDAERLHAALELAILGTEHVARRAGCSICDALAAHVVSVEDPE